MRTGLVLSAGLLYCSTTAVAALAASPAPPPPPPPTEGGSIQALLERYSAKARHGVVPLNQHKSSSSTNQTVPLPGGQMPGGGGGGGGGGDGQLHSNDKRSPYVILPHPPRQPTAVRLDPSSPDVSLAQPSAGVVATASVDAQEERLIKRVRPQDAQHRRWLWATRIVREPESEKTAAFSEARTADAKDGLPTSTQGLAKIRKPKSAMVKHHHSTALSHDEHTVGGRRWIWGPSIIQDGDTNAPPIGSNVNLFPNGAQAATPMNTLVAPTFPPLPLSPASASPSIAAVAISSAISKASLIKAAAGSVSEPSFESAANVVSAVAASVSQVALSASASPRSRNLKQLHVRLSSGATHSPATTSIEWMRPPRSPPAAFAATASLAMARVNARAPRYSMTTVPAIRMNKEGKRRTAFDDVDDKAPSFAGQNEDEPIEDEPIEDEQVESDGLVTDLFQYEAEPDAADVDVDGDVVESEDVAVIEGVEYEDE